MEESELSFIPDKIILWKENGLWYSQIENSDVIQWPIEIEGQEFNHSLVTAIQLAKRIVKLYPTARVFSNELSESGKRKRLA